MIKYRKKKGVYMGIINFFKRKKQPKFKITNQNIELPKTEVEDAKIIDILNQEILDFFQKMVLGQVVVLTNHLK